MPKISQSTNAEQAQFDSQLKQIGESWSAPDSLTSDNRQEWYLRRGDADVVI